MGLLMALVALPLFADDAAEGLTIREIRIEGLKHTHEPLVREQLTSEVESITGTNTGGSKIVTEAAPTQPTSSVTVTM